MASRQSSQETTSATRSVGGVRGSDSLQNSELEVTVIDPEVVALGRVVCKLLNTECIIEGQKMTPTHDLYKFVRLPSKLYISILDGPPEEDSFSDSSDESFFQGMSSMPEHVTQGSKAKGLLKKNPTKRTTHVAGKAPVGEPSLQQKKLIQLAKKGMTGSSAAKKKKDAPEDDVSSSLPTFIRNSIPVQLTEMDLANLREHFFTPDCVEMRLPREGECLFYMEKNPSDEGGP